MSQDEIIAALEAADASERILEIFAFIFSLLFMVIYIVFFYKLRRYEASMNASKRNKIATNPWIMILPTLYTFCYTLRYLLRMISTATDYKDVPLQIAFDAGFIIGNALFYVIMLLRLALGFRGTQYELTRIKLILCCIMLIGVLLINIFHYLIKRHGVGDETIITGSSLSSFNQWNEDEVHNHLFIALVLSNLFFAVFLIYLFVRNIVLMIMAQMECDTETKKDLSETHVKWLSIAIKYALLCGIAIFCANLQFSLWILFSLDVFEGNPVGAITFGAFNDWLWIVVLLNNYFCILLTFPGDAKYAYDHICVSCHGCCQSLIKQCIFKCLERENKAKIKVNSASPGSENERELQVKDIKTERTRTLEQLAVPLDDLVDQISSEQDIEKQNTNHVVIGMSMAELQQELASAD